MPDPLVDRSTRIRWIAVAIIVAVTILRILYLLYLCPYDLAPDEGHYWDWSRHLDWSYYSKGPLVAWIIRAGVEVFGEMSLSIQGTLMPAVRIPAVLCGSGLLAAIYILTYQTHRSDRLALVTMLICLAFPAFALCSIIMTIDAPFLCCWGWALVFGGMAFVDGKRWAWPVLGLLVALGILAKYTMALWLFSAGLFVLFTPTHRALLFKLDFWVMVAVAGLSAIPILYWNSQHDWVTFKHVAVQAGVAESEKATAIRWRGPFKFAGGQAALLLGFWFLAWVVALVYYRPRLGLNANARFLWWMSLPTFLIFGVSSLRADGQINWPVAAYISGTVLIAGFFKKIIISLKGFLRFAAICFFWLAIVSGVLLSFVLHDFRLVTDRLGGFIPAETPEKPLPARDFDPVARLKGSRYLAEELDKIRHDLQLRDGQDPVIAGLRWDQPGLIGFYCEGHPQVYTIGLLLRLDRHSQYDLWHPNPVDDAQAFLGRTFLIVGGGDPRGPLASSFESVDVPQEVVYRENGRALARWFVCVCHGFKGFDPALQQPTEAGH